MFFGILAVIFVRKGQPLICFSYLRSQKRTTTKTEERQTNGNDHSRCAEYDGYVDYKIIDIIKLLANADVGECPGPYGNGSD